MYDVLACKFTNTIKRCQTVDFVAIQTQRAGRHWTKSSLFLHYREQTRTIFTEKLATNKTQTHNFTRKEMDWLRLESEKAKPTIDDNSKKTTQSLTSWKTNTEGTHTWVQRIKNKTFTVKNFILKGKDIKRARWNADDNEAENTTLMNKSLTKRVKHLT